MMLKRWLPMFAGMLSLALSCQAQHGTHWRVYRASDGMPESYTASITFAQRNHVWVRHPHFEWAGRLDGYEVKEFPAPGLGTSRIYESPSGQIWTCTIDGLLRYDNTVGAWTRYDFPEVNSYLRSNAVTVYRQSPLYPLRQNHVLLLLPNALLDCNTESPQSVAVIRNATNTGMQRFLGLATDVDGGFWISGAKGLAKIPGPIKTLKSDTSWNEYLLPSELKVRNLRDPVVDTHGGVTMVGESLDGSRQVVVFFDGQNWFSYPTSEKLLAAWRGLDKQFWLCTQTSLLHLNPEDRSMVPEPSVPARRFLDVSVETNGVFWLASSEGLLRYAPFCWDIPPAASWLDSYIYAVNEDHEGRFWAATAASLSLLQKDRWTNFVFPKEIVDQLHDVRSLIPLPNGNIAMEAGNALLQFDPGTSKFNFVNGPHAGQLKLLGALKDGKLICAEFTDQTNAAAHSWRLTAYDGTGFSPLPFAQPALSAETEPQTIFSSGSGDIWLVGRRAVFKLHDQKWQTYSPNSPASSTISAFLEFNDHKIWCALEDKIVEFDGTAWNSVRYGFDHINGMLKASDGSVWVASDDGLYRFYQGTWMANGSEEGLPTDVIRAVYQDRQGRIWAATAQGLCQFHPEADPDVPRTYVQNLAEKNNSVRQGDIVNISFHGQDKWKFTPEDRLLYSYHLDGRDWSQYQEQRSVSFLDLPAGKHSLYVRAMDRNWNVDPKPAILEFSVTLPWYLETRLVLISLLGLAGALFFAGLAFNRHRRLVRSYAEVEAKVALRTQQLELANQELFHSQKMNALGTLAAGIAHDFNNILSIIKGSAQIIETNIEDKDKIRTRTERIKTVVEQGSGIVKAMLGFSRGPDNPMAFCDINDAVKETVLLLGDRFLREIEVQFTPLPSLPRVPASKDFVQQILLNFIFNAADAMTDKRSVLLSVAHTNRLPEKLALKPAAAPTYVTISVKDFGAGIAPEIMPRIFEPFFTTKAFSTRRGTGLGLSMVYELARQMDGGLSVESTPGQGSIFTLILPVRDLPMDETQKSDTLD